MAIMTVFEFPDKDSFKMYVSLESRNGGLPFFFLANSEMTRAKADKLWLMATPSFNR